MAEFPGRERSPTARAERRSTPTNRHPILEVVTIATFAGHGVETMSEASVQRADQKIDVILGGLLRTGVLLAAAIVFVGGVVYLARHHLPVTNYRVFQGEPAELRTWVYAEAGALYGLKR